MEALKFTPEQLIKAKKQGFKGKKPKKPKAKANLRTLENYIVRYNEYVKKIKLKASEYDKKLQDLKKREILKNKVRSL